MEEKNISKEIAELLEEESKEVFAERVKDFNPLDIADILQDFDEEEKISIISALDTPIAALVIDETDDQTREVYIENATSREISRIINVMPPDEAADLLEVLPLEKKEEILRLVDKPKAENIRKLAKYDPETAGGIMTTKFVSIPEDISAQKAIMIIQGAYDAETISRIFVTDKAAKLKGVVSIKDLLTASPVALISDLIGKEVIKVQTDEDQEEAAHLVDKYNLSVLPVVDRDDRLKGIITVDDVIDVIGEEASEDMFRIAGTAAIHPTQEPVLKRVFMRLPWLITTLIGGFVACLILNAYDRTLDEMIAIAFFIPIILGMSGNVGLQSSTVIVRGLATGEVDFGRLFKVIFGEITVGLTIGLLCGLSTGVVAYLLKSNFDLCWVVALSMFCGISLAAIVGTSIPLICTKIGIDPAVAAGPFITTMNDVLGLLIYLTIATATLIHIH